MIPAPRFKITQPKSESNFDISVKTRIAVIPAPRFNIERLKRTKRTRTRLENKQCIFQSMLRRGAGCPCLARPSPAWPCQARPGPARIRLGGSGPPLQLRDIFLPLILNPYGHTSTILILINQFANALSAELMQFIESSNNLSSHNLKNSSSGSFNSPFFIVWLNHSMTGLVCALVSLFILYNALLDLE